MFDKNANYNKYFLRIIQEFDESTVLNPDLNGRKTPKLNQKEVEINLNEIKEFCNNNEISENTLFLAGASLALNKFNFTNKTLIFHENDTVFTTVFENRKTSIKDYLLKIEKDYKENLKYASFSIDKLIEEFELNRSFYYSFNKDLDLDSFKHRYDFYLNIQKTPEKFLLSADYNNQLYSDKYVILFLESIESIINQFISSDICEITLSDISLVDETEEYQLTDLSTPLVHKRFENQVDKHPDKLALVSDGERLTFDELNRKANKIANALINKGVKPRSNILIMFPRNSNLIASIFGVLKAGSAYIPIDLAFPKERIYYMYQNSQADYILAESEDVIENAIGIGELLQEENDENPDVDVSPDDLVYLLYTSGSTGLPKGVMGAHRNLTGLFSEEEDDLIYQIYSKIEKNLGIITVAFVAFNADFMSLMYGNTLIFANDEEVKNIES